MNRGEDVPELEPGEAIVSRVGGGVEYVFPTAEGNLCSYVVLSTFSRGIPMHYNRNCELALRLGDEYEVVPADVIPREPPHTAATGEERAGDG